MSRTCAPCLAYLSFDRLPVVKWATKVELYRALVRGRAFIGKNFREPICLSDAAKAACMSPYHFNRFFHALFGETPHAYLTGLRLGAARDLLRTSDLPAGDIGLRVGLEQASSFSRAFKKHYGLSPKDYRLSISARSDKQLTA